jgi:hypothetical protein
VGFSSFDVQVAAFFLFTGLSALEMWRQDRTASDYGPFAYQRRLALRALAEARRLRHKF